MLIKRLITVLVITGAVFGGVFGWQYLQRSGQSMGGGPAPAVVSSVEVVRESWIPAIPAVGSVVPTQGISVAPEVPGRVSEIFFRTGQHVDKGDRILQLDDTVDRAELDSLLADRKLARLTLDRTRQLAADNLASAADLDRAEAELEKVAADVATKQALIRKKDIRAPFTGELGIRRVSPGRYLAEGEEVVTLTSLSPIFVEFSLPERYLELLEIDQTIEAEIRARAGRVFEGKLFATDPVVDEGTRSLRVRALFDNEDGLLRPGMFAEVRVLGREAREVVTVPQHAVVYAPYGSSVFVIDEQEGQTVGVRRQVQTGEVRDGRLEIRNGVEPGDMLVATGQNKLRSGQPITIDNSVELETRPQGP